MISFAACLAQRPEIAVPGPAKGKPWKAKLPFGAFIVLAAVATADRAAFSGEKVALTGPELSALLAKGLSISATDMAGGKNYTARMTYATNGTLSGAVTFNGKAPIDVKGTWKLDGSRVCRTIVPFQPQEVCETWLKSGSNEVTIRVGDTDVGISRWQ